MSFRVSFAILTLCHRRTREIFRGMKKETPRKNRVEIKTAIFLPDLNPYTRAAWSALKQRWSVPCPPPLRKGLWEEEGLNLGKQENIFPTNQQLSQDPITKCMWEWGRETKDTNNHRPGGMHFIPYSYQDPDTHSSSFHSQGGQVFSAPCFWRSKEENDLPKIMACGKLDLNPAFYLLNVCTNDDA